MAKWFSVPDDRRSVLSTLWIFATLNFVYADVVTIFDHSVQESLGQTALLGSAVLVETAIAMVLLSRFLDRPANRVANVVVGAINAVAVVASLVVATPHAYYALFAAIELASMVVVIGYAWSWTEPRATPVARPMTS